MSIITLREKTIDEKAEVINSKYQPKIDFYKDLLVTAIAADGVVQQARVTDYQTKYKALLLQKNTELEALENV